MIVRTNLTNSRSAKHTAVIISWTAFHKWNTWGPGSFSWYFSPKSQGSKTAKLVLAFGPYLPDCKNDIHSTLTVGTQTIETLPLQKQTNKQNPSFCRPFLRVKGHSQVGNLVQQAAYEGQLASVPCQQPGASPAGFQGFNDLCFLTIRKNKQTKNLQSYGLLTHRNSG